MDDTTTEIPMAAEEQSDEHETYYPIEHFYEEE